ncbi:D-alanyl-D-alanine endopeptidase (penicillin-binding protein 7) [Marinimicrobium koreense]|uniref:D-alanyl-D-alanine endopeptidase (Penicillin-binding protein 7) n=1 Tax=Marinimicrobium koreense TaxID=306545 RepID=A0A3N1NTF3_9GAMM|nr:D-alanyl-D-alanine endopeptidase [Marinimicrobium koreense]ROQ18458.1 D-alanyl-D-alanine endopeptidase (penicillin-binding protein 7) [Marinimicrobium koreense]
MTLFNKVRSSSIARFLPCGALLALLLAPVVLAEETPDPERLRLASVSAAVAPIGAETPFYTKRADWSMPIASVTKLMTGLVVLESGASLNEWLTVEERHFPPAANAFSRLRPGSEAQRGDLLRIALMSSENYAAYLLARHHPEGYDAFIEAMNEKARSLGMTRTRFVDSSGLSDDNVSSAGDLLKLAQAAYGNETLRELSADGRHSVRFRKPGYTLHFGNTNPLVHSGRWDVDLTKTGYLTAAGRCLVMVTEMNGEPTAVVLLNSFGTRTPLGDAGRIRRWIENGTASTVAQAALRYEQETAERLSGQQVAESGAAQSP